MALVADTPVKRSTGPYTNPGVPSEVVAETPVNPIDICVGDIVPILDVAETPVTETVSADSPQFS